MSRQVNLILDKYNWNVQLRDEADESVFSEIFKLHEYRIADEVIGQAQYPIIDVGAHAGFFTMHARSLNADVHIVAIEPEPNNIAVLQKHVKENKIKKVTIVEAALAADSGLGKLVIAPDSHNHFLSPVVIPSEAFRPMRDLSEKELDSGKILAPPLKLWAARGRSAQDNSAEGTKNISVKTLSFADLLKQYKIEKISLLKMDIEGGEYEVFEGMSEADLQVVNYAILEYHNGREKSKEIEEKLRQNGFGVQVFPSKFDKTMGFMFAHNKRFK